MFVVHTQSDVIQLSEYTEDGEAIFRDVHYVVARDENGFQFQSTRSFQGWDIGQVREDCAQFEKEVAADIYEADPTLAQMRESESFFEIRASYGSPAYQRCGGEQELIDLERKEAHEGW